MTDLLLERLTAPAPTTARDSLGEIPWPDGLAPKPDRDALPYVVNDPLPKVDVVVMPYTTAETEATADVLTPGVEKTSWSAYTHRMAEYEDQLTGRSPAREEKCLAHVCVTEIGGLRVLTAQSALHLSTDGKSMPVRQLVQQIAAETGCRLFITTGTAGGVGATEVLGDVVIGQAAKFNLAHSQWEQEPFAQTRYSATGLPLSTRQQALLKTAFADLIPAAIGDSLKPSGYAARAPQLIVDRDIETVGYFAFADTDDEYGVVANDPAAGCEEMDDAAVALALSQLDSPPRWLAIRNASDPQMGTGPLSEQKQAAARIYARYGYTTTVCSSLAVWAVIAGLA